MYQQDTKSVNFPTHTERLLEYGNRIVILESLVEQLVRVLGETVGVHIPGPPGSAPGTYGQFPQ